QAEFKRVVRLAGLSEDYSPHSMRHTFATSHILAGKPAAWVSRQLGHKDVTVTLKVYAAAFEMVDATAADEHGARLFPTPPVLVGDELAIDGQDTPPEPAPVLH